jgi:hypothetical protein
MDGSASSVIMFGLGNGTFAGSPSLLVTRGLGIGETGTTAYSLEYTCPARNFDYTAPDRIFAYDTRPRVLDYTPPSPR